MFDSKLDILLTLTIGSMVKFAALYQLQPNTKEEKQAVGKLSRITLFPVKAMRGVDVSEAMCMHDGLMTGNIHDRFFVVVDSNVDYQYMSIKRIPKMALVEATIDGQFLELKAPGLEPFHVQFPDEDRSKILSVIVRGESTQGVDCGDEVSSWLETALGKPGLRLVQSRPGLQNRKCVDGPSPWHKLSKPQDEVVYQDGFPYMLMTEASVADLNGRLEKNVNIDHFRPNLVIDGCEAFDEDKWNKIYIGDAEFTNIKPCQRCIVTTVNPQTGIRDPNMEPLKTLKQYRMLYPDMNNSPCFGVNLVVDRPGTIRSGDVVYATFK